MHGATVHSLYTTTQERNSVIWRYGFLCKSSRSTQRSIKGKMVTTRYIFHCLLKEPQDSFSVFPPLQNRSRHTSGTILSGQYFTELNHTTASMETGGKIVVRNTLELGESLGFLCRGALLTELNTVQNPKL